MNNEKLTNLKGVSLGDTDFNNMTELAQLITEVTGRNSNEQDAIRWIIQKYGDDAKQRWSCAADVLTPKKD